MNYVQKSNDPYLRNKVFVSHFKERRIILQSGFIIFAVVYIEPLSGYKKIKSENTFS
jgi:hypothetical protein